MDNLGITLEENIIWGIVKRRYGFENPEAVAGCGRYVRREKDGDKIIYILYPYRKKQKCFGLKQSCCFEPTRIGKTTKKPNMDLPLYFEKSRESHSFSRNPTRTKVSPMTNGRFTSMPSVARRASCSSSDIEASLSLRFSWR